MAIRAANLYAISQLKKANNFNCKTPTDVDEVVSFLCLRVVEGVGMPSIPPVTAHRMDVGECYMQLRKNLCRGKSFLEIPAVIRAPAVMNTESEIRSIIAANANMAPIIQAMVQAWKDDAGQYHQDRIASARKQMSNDGVPPDEQSEILDNPERLRSYIRERRQEYLETLEEAWDSVNHPDPLKPATAKQRQLLAHTQSWFPGGQDSGDEYLPNDSAVEYLFLVMEILLMLHELGSCHSEGLKRRFAYFCQIAGSHLTGESTGKGYVSMSMCGTALIDGVDISPVVRSYPSDLDRNKDVALDGAHKKHKPSQQRAALRLLRIVAIGCDCPCAFQILNMAGSLQFESLVELSALEAIIAAAIQAAKDIKDGDEGLLLSHSMLWLLIAGRSNIFTSIFGRNDLSVPRVAAAATGMTMDGLGELPARPWALTSTIEAWIPATVRAQVSQSRGDAGTHPIPSGDEPNESGPSEGTDGIEYEEFDIFAGNRDFTDGADE